MYGHDPTQKKTELFSHITNEKKGIKFSAKNVTVSCKKKQVIGFCLRILRNTIHDIIMSIIFISTSEDNELSHFKIERYLIKHKFSLKVYSENVALKY